MPSTEPLVSIVIPAYNHARYLDEAISSVLGQSYASVELIVLDDGSRDDTRKVLQRYGTRFYWESQPNIGQSATLSKGWTKAHGEILGYLSADDRLEPSAVAESVAALGAHPDVVATYCDFNLIDPRSQVVRRVRAPEYDYRSMLVTVTCAPGPGAFFRRSAYEKTGPWDRSLRQMPDYDFWLRLGLQGAFVRIPKPLAAFRIHEASQTYGIVSAERAMEPVVILSRAFEHPELPQALKPLRNEAMANASLIAAQLHLRAGRFRDGWRAVRFAAKSDPRVLGSFRTLRLLANAAFNRAGHRALWTLRSLMLGSRK
jgi:glycosyltransferase involved in cell wall biosynthesis